MRLDSAWIFISATSFQAQTVPVPGHTGQPLRRHPLDPVFRDACVSELSALRHSSTRLSLASSDSSSTRWELVEDGAAIPGAPKGYSTSQGRAFNFEDGPPQLPQFCLEAAKPVGTPVRRSIALSSEENLADAK